MTPFVIVTGLSGAGKSLLLRSLEDLGYEVIDNLPLSLLLTAAREERVQGRPIAFGIDVRSRHFSGEELRRILSDLRASGIAVTLLFLESDDAILERRYRETRRHHPLVGDSTLAKGIQEERLLLESLRECADQIWDTSLLTPPEVKARVREQFTFEFQKTLVIHVLSFAFREGIPREADMLFDLRFLKNPHYDPALKTLTGEVEQVRAYIAQDPVFQNFWEHLMGMLRLILPRIEDEGRNYFTIAFGCTGGQHRSVAMAEWTSRWLTAAGYTVQTLHRELAR